MGKLINSLVVLSGITMLTPGLSHASWYIGLGAGQTNTETESLDISDTLGPVSGVTDDSDKSIKLFGGWRATPSFALEFGYVDLGKYSMDYHSPTGNWHRGREASALFLEGVASIYLGSGWRFLGKLGYAYWDGKADYSNNSPFSDSGSDNGLDPVLGLGFEYGINFAATRLGVRLEWEQYQNVWEGVSYNVDSTFSNSMNGLDVNTFGVALSFDF
jgi:hypothetical protein